MSAHSYEYWRHGGWYVLDVHYPNGAVGCVSRNYPDRKWRIVDHDGPESITYASRDAAADAEAQIAARRCPTHVDRYYCDADQGHEGLHYQTGLIACWSGDVACTAARCWNKREGCVA